MMRKKAPSFNLDMILCECISESHDKHIMTTICYTVLWQKGGENCFQENANLAGSPIHERIGNSVSVKGVEEKMISTSKTVLKSEGRRIETNLFGSVVTHHIFFFFLHLIWFHSLSRFSQEISRRWNDKEIDLLISERQPFLWPKGNS